MLRSHSMGPKLETWPPAPDFSCLLTQTQGGNVRNLSNWIQTWIVGDLNWILCFWLWQPGHLGKEPVNMSSVYLCLSASQINNNHFNKIHVDKTGKRLLRMPLKSENTFQDEKEIQINVLKPKEQFFFSCQNHVGFLWKTYSDSVWETMCLRQSDMELALWNCLGYANVI